MILKYMNVDIKQLNKNLDYLILNYADDETLNKLKNFNAFPDGSSLYFFNKTTGQTIKIPNQKISTLFSKNYENLKSLIETIVERNRKISSVEVVEKLKERVYLEFTEYLKTTGLLTFKNILNSKNELPDNSYLGEIYFISEDNSLLISNGDNSWIEIYSSEYVDKIIDKFELSEHANSEIHNINEKIDLAKNELLLSYNKLKESLKNYVTISEVEELNRINRNKESKFKEDLLELNILIDKHNSKLNNAKLEFEKTVKDKENELTNKLNTFISEYNLYIEQKEDDYNLSYQEFKTECENKLTAIQDDINQIKHENNELIKKYDEDFKEAVNQYKNEISSLILEQVETKYSKKIEELSSLVENLSSSLEYALS